jgi:hypothetical protein
MKPHPKVSPKKYEQKTQPAKVKWKIKGNADGHIYRGQNIERRCPTCNPPLPNPHNRA